MVNNDKEELKKHDRYDLTYHQDCKYFIQKLNSYDRIDSYREGWLDQCRLYNKNFPTIEEHHIQGDIEYKNSYVFMDNISDYLKPNHIIVSGMGTPMVSSHQALRLKKNQRKKNLIKLMMQYLFY